MPPDPSADDLVTKYVEAALDPYRDEMPPEDLEVYRLRLYMYYETDPEAVTLLDEIREAQRPHDAPVVERSGERIRQDDEALAKAVELKAADRKAGGGKGGAR
jgi:hypothetical protein